MKSFTRFLKIIAIGVVIVTGLAGCGPECNWACGVSTWGKDGKAETVHTCSRSECRVQVGGNTSGCLCE